MDEFDKGALIAIGLFAHLYGQTTLAAEVAVQMGLENSDCSSLDEYDQTNLMLLTNEDCIKFVGL